LCESIRASQRGQDDPVLAGDSEDCGSPILILELIDESGGSKEAVVEGWMSANGKKKTAFYDRLGELPEDTQRRFRALPDKRSAAGVTEPPLRVETA
jgi:hypothetical protein